MSFTSHYKEVEQIAAQAAYVLDRLIDERNAAKGSDKRRLRRLVMKMEHVVAAANEAEEELMD